MSEQPVTQTERGFWALVITQFQNAFVDNAFKSLLTLIALHVSSNLSQSNTWNTIIMLVFALPFFFFSMTGGSFADKYSKRDVIISTKFMEIGVMLLVALALWIGNLWIIIGILFLTGTQSAFFGPCKYGIIPELVSEKRLSWANGILELTTFAAIILGTVAGSVLIVLFKSQLYISGLILAVLAVIGTLLAWRIPRVPAAAPEKPIRINFFKDVIKYIKLARKDTLLWMAVLGNTFFWFLATFLFANIPVFGRFVLHIQDTHWGSLMVTGDIQFGLLLVSLALGIGIGSYAAGKLSGNKIEYGMIPLGSLMICMASLYMFIGSQSFIKTIFALSVLGFGGGFFAVPLNALIQHRPLPENKGTIQGMSYFLSNIGMLAGPAFYYLLSECFKIRPVGIFFAGFIVTLGATGYYLYRLPESLIRLVLWALTNTFYRIKVVGRDNIPERGGALFVTNHMSFTDALFMIASTDRFIRFIMYTGFYKIPFIKPFAQIMRAIPMSAEDGARDLIHSFREATDAIESGDIVCIFAEGQITRIGQMLPFRRGFERIMKGLNAPIIPVHLDRIWGVVLSYKNGKMVWFPTHQIPYPITVSYGKPLPANTPVHEVRRTVQELATDSFQYRKKNMRPLHRAFFEEARRHPHKFAMADMMNPKIKCWELMARSIILGLKLKSHWQGQEMVGIFVPTSVAAATTNIAAFLCGKVPVNLNYTLSQETLDTCIKQCNLQTVVTSRAFMEKIKLTIPVKTIYLEDIATQVNWWDKIRGGVLQEFSPVWFIEKYLGSRRNWKLDDMATIIFSSGSTGDPKGVMLSHYNVYANLDETAQIMTMEDRDRILGVLPFFHSFGYTATLWFPLIKGIGAIYHPNPMDARSIGILAEKYMITLMVATPTFLQTYIRRVAPGQFGTLRFLLVGGEKLSEKTALAFEDQFGTRPYEAYGCTECSPAIAISTTNYRARGFYQVGRKLGSIGHPLPGVSAKIVDPDTMKPLPTGQSGLLLVKGPNVMMGYYNQPEKTAAVLKDGWYNTGDIATMDDDGFLIISDRLSRFSKIGGEMVPHIKIEDTLHQLAGSTEQTFAVTSVPDERKGERLIVLHKLPEEQIKEVYQKLSTSGLPNLWIPRLDSFLHVDTIPILGTGKTDLRGIKQLALSLTSAQVF